MSPFEEARRSLGDGPSQARRREQLARLLRTATVQRTHPRWRPPRPRLALVTLGLGLASAGTLITLVALSPAETSSPSTPRPVAGMRLEGSTVPALDFVDGSSVKLEATSTARLDVVDEGRVELTLERGTLAAHVQKDTGRTWRYHVGPWLVVVRGTRLSLRYAPELGELEVSVSEGAVEVTGPGGPARVARGQTLRRNVSATNSLQGTGLALPSVEPARTLAVPRPQPTRQKPAQETRPDAGAPWASASWLELLDRGRRAAALHEAERQGVWARLEALDDEVLLRLADAARLERRGPLTRALLTHALERQGPSAAEAAYLLGRLDAGEGRLTAARASFSRALSLSPDGPFAEQSRGRLLEVLLELQALPEARAEARDYLEQHPAGAWAGLARRLAEEPP